MTWHLASTEGDSYAGAKTVGLDLYDRDDDMYGRGTTYYLAEQTANGAPWVHNTWTSAGTARAVMIPTYVVSGATIKLDVLADGGAPTFEPSLRITGTDSTPTTTNGTTVTFDHSGYTITTLSLTVPDNTWAGTIITIAVEGKWISGGGALSVKCERVGLNLWFAEV